MATDLKDFTKGILARKTADLETALAQKQVEQDRRLSTAKETIAASEAEAIAAIEEASRQREARAIQTLENAHRNQLLSARQEALQGVFDKAYAEMVAWDQQSFETFLYQVIDQLPKAETYTLTLGSLSPEPSELPEHVQLLPERVVNQAGFLLETGGIRYNYWFKILLADMMPDMVNSLYQQLED